MNAAQTTKDKEKKFNFIHSYKDKYEIKCKKIHDMKTPTEKNIISKIFKKTYYIKEKNQAPLLKLNKSNSVFNYNKINIINNFGNNKLNDSTKFNDNILNITSKKKEYLNPIKRNKKEEIIQSPSFSYLHNALKEKLLFDHINSNNKRYKERLKKCASNKNIFNIKKSPSSHNYINIRQKFLFQRNNDQKNIFNNKSFQNLCKTSKNVNITNKSNLINSISIKELSPNISEKDKLFDTKLIRMHGIDLKLKELLEKYHKGENEKNNEKIEKDKKIKKLINIAQFYDKLPSLIQRKKDKYWIKPCKKPQLNDFGQSYFSTVKKMKNEEIRRKKFDKMIQKYPIIRYLFLQKILNSLVHKIKLFGKKQDDLLISSNSLFQLSDEINDFITYGYEFIPENILIRKNIESPKDLLLDDEFIQVVLNTKSSIDNSLNNEPKDFSFIKLELGLISNSAARLNSNNIQENSSYKNIWERFLEMQINKDSLAKKSRFLHKKININKINIDKKDTINTFNSSMTKKLNKNTTSFDKTKIMSNKNINNNIEKKENVKVNTNTKTKAHSNNNKKINTNSTNNKGMLNQIMNILYEDINDIDNIIKKNKKKIKKNDKTKLREKFWSKLLKRGDKDNSQILIIKKRRRKNSSEIYKTKNKNKFYYKYQFESFDKRKIKTIKNDFEAESPDNSDISEYEVENITNNYLKPKKPYNVYYKNYENTLIPKKKQKINITKKTERKSPKLKNIAESKDSFKENKKKENSITHKNDKKMKKSRLSHKKTKKKKKAKDESSDSNSSESSKEEKEDSLYTSINLEDVEPEEYKENKEEKKYKKKIKIKENSKKEKNSFKDYLSEYQNQINNMKNNKIISNLIDTENQKKNREKEKIIIKTLTSSKENENENDKTDEINITKTEKKINFNDINRKSFENIEKKKKELLNKLQDMQYKISKGDIDFAELENFKLFTDEINNLKERYEGNDMNTYIKNMELFFKSFQEEMENIEKKKLEEERINKYLKQFYEDYNFKNFYKDIQRKMLCKVINFSQINHINILSDKNKKSN